VSRTYQRSAVTFRGHLHDQRGRQDPVGDLARAVLGGLCSGPGCPFTSSTALARHLAAHHPEVGDDVFAAIRPAVKEHRRRGGAT
jgi:hypothetical protein